MNTSNDNIPTLTDIITTGDDDMLNHFDAHRLSREEIEDITEETDTSDFLADADLDDIPSVELEPAQADTIYTDTLKRDPEIYPETPPDLDSDFSEAIQLDAQHPEDNDADISDIKDKIDTAIKELLPEIEESLKQKLYKKFNI